MGAPSMEFHVVKIVASNDSFFYSAVEPDSLIAVLWHFSRFTN